MGPQITAKLYNHFLVLLLLCVWLTYVSCHARSGIDNNSNNNKGIECMESERDALIEFKSGIYVDRCGLLDSWGVTQDCCMWYGIHCHNHSGHVIALRLPTLVLNSYISGSIPEPCLEGTIGVSILGLKQLKYIDLSYNYFGGGGQLPKFIGSLSNLEHLDLCTSGFTGVIPQEIGNLSRLAFLNLFSVGYNLRVENMRWLSQLRLLRYVNLGGIDLSVVTNSWLSIVNNLPLLQFLHLELCNLSLKLPSSLSYINSSKTLSSVDLYKNNLNDTSIFEWLSNLGGVENYLVYLDLSYNKFGGQLPKFIGSFSNLEDLLLSNSGFTGVIPQEIGNLSKLISLGLDGNYLRVENMRWLSQLRSLRQVNLGGIDLSVATNSWLSIVNNLPHLQVLGLELCNLSLKFPSSLSYINSSKTLATVDLHGNNFNDTSIFEWLSNLGGVENNLVNLDLSDNYQLFESNSQGTGYAMNFLGKLCSLQNLRLLNTSLNYDLLHIIESLSLCSYKSLMFLNLAGNQVWGSIPDNIGNLTYLRELYLDVNQLNGTISEALGGLSMLDTLKLSSNSLKGVFTSAHLSNLSSLSILMLGQNTELVVNISASWVPPFQLVVLHLESCKVGPDFPIWLITQKNLIMISISNTSISAMIPVSFFNSLSPKLEVLAMSLNKMYGVLPDVSITFVTPPVFELHSNSFSGAIPSFMRNASYLGLNNNNLSQGLVPLLCPQTKMPLIYLDLSNNSFSDKLPDCWGYFDKLSHLHLQNNQFWGNLPVSIGRLNQLQTLILSSNNLTGELPASLINCTSLIFLDLSHNSLSGYLPSALGNMFQNLSIFILRDNKFFGALPSSFCHLSRLQILDFSNNRISGTIPRCIYNLTGMAATKNLVHSITFYFYTHFSWVIRYEDALIIWKDQEQSIRLVQSIDLSNNMLNGQIPEEVSNLVGLVQINLSRNHLSGVITSKIGQQTSLESLDLSHNHLSGEIPTSLAKISSLEVLDLSYNNLSGEIPHGTQLQSFNTSSYIGNPGLCGAPLPKCDADTVVMDPRNNIDVEHRNDYFMLGVYISVVLGFIIGFWGVVGTLVIKRSWRHAFFRFYDDVKDRIHVMVVVNMRRIWRRT